MSRLDDKRAARSAELEIATPDRASTRRRVVLVAVALIAVTASLLPAWTSQPAAGPPSDDAAKLALLIAFMAAMKAAFAIGATSAIYWRLGSAASPITVAAYGVSAILMLSGPALIWPHDHVAAGAGLFHAGLAVFIATALFDGLAVRVAGLPTQSEPRPDDTSHFGSNQRSAGPS